MTNIPEDEPVDELAGEPIRPLESVVEAPVETHTYVAQEFPPQDAPAGFPPADAPFLEPTPVEPLMFQSVLAPEPPPPARIPHLGHFFLLLLLLVFGFIGAVIAVLIAIHFHLYGVTSLEGTKTEIHYTLGSEGLVYVFTLILCMIVFPLLWHKSFFAGVQWNGATAIRLRWRLVGGAVACLLLALINSLVLPGPAHAPIEDIFKEKGAAWLLFIFGVTFAPFFEEMFFRGFLLPTLCTACDWTDETIFNRPNLTLSSASRFAWSVVVMTLISCIMIGLLAALVYAFIKHSLILFLIFLPIGPAIYWGLASIRSPEANNSIRPLAANGHPQWSFPAMAIAAVVTSLPFAGMHAAQTGYSVGPFLLLLGVSIVLCTVRLSTRSLASSTLVHASYNFMLFSIMLIGTSGFRHLDKM